MTAAWLATDEGLMVTLAAVALFAAIGWSYLESKAAQAAKGKR